MVIFIKQHVTPLAGVWIEIACDKEGRLRRAVTPLAGVWIEIASTPVAV